METYQILGQYTFYVDVQFDHELSEKSNITLNSFPKRGSTLPIPCKYQWFRNKQQIDNQGNIYQCCALDIGYSIEVHVTSYEDEYTGKAIIQFKQIRLSESLERILLSLIVNAQRTTVSAMDSMNIQRIFEFIPDQITIGLTQVSVRFPNFSLESSPQDVKSMKIMGAFLLNLNISDPELSLKFLNRDDRDIFMACITSVYSLKHVHYRTIIDNIGQIIESTNTKALIHWVLTHKVCQIPHQVQQVQQQQTGKLHTNYDDYHIIKAQNQQLQIAITNLHSNRQINIPNANEPSERLQKTNPPRISSQDLQLRSPSSKNSIENKQKKEIENLILQIERFKKNQTNSNQLSQLQTELDRLIRENSDLKKRCTESEQKQQAVNQIFSSQKYNQEYQNNSGLNDSQSNEPLEKMVLSLKQELKVQFLQDKKLQKRIKELEGEVQRLNILDQSVLRQSMLTVDDQQLKALEERIEDAKRFNNKLKEEIDRLRRKNGSLQEEVDQLKQNSILDKTDLYKEKLLSLEKENRLLKEKVIPSPVKANDKQMQNLVKLNEKLMIENSDLQKKLTDLNDDVNLIKNLSQSRVFQGSNTQEQVNEKKQIIESLENENQYLKKKIELLLRDQQKNLLDGLNQKQTQSPMEREKLIDRIKVLEAQVIKLKEQSQRYIDENMNQFDEIRNLKDQIDLRSLGQSRIKDSFIDDALQLENKQLQNQLSGLRNEINQIRNNQKINNSEQYTTLQHDDSVKLLKMELQNEQLRVQIKELQSQHKNNGSQTDNEEIQILQFQVQKLQSTNQRVMEQNTMLMEQIKHLQEELCSKSLSQSRIDDSMSRILEKPNNNYRAWGNN